MLKEIFSNFPTEVKTIIITIITSILTVFISSFIKYIYSNYSLNYKLKREYIFSQNKLIKEEISKYKMYLLNSCEEFNDRLWNFTNNIGKEWHKIKENDYGNPDNYYIHSFVYRFMILFYYIYKTDESTISFDSTIAENKDMEYLKFIKTMKNIFCDALLLKSFNYKPSTQSNHFFKNNFYNYINFIQENGIILNYDQYLNKIKNNSIKIKPVIDYFVNIEESIDNINYTIVKEFHIIIIIFLNLFGHDYQKTSNTKIKRLLKENYKCIKNKTDFEQYMIRSKLINKIKKYIKMLNCA
jgi:hypothetical protein